MRLFAILIAASSLSFAAPAYAVENFIPMGHNYSPDDPQLPEFNSEQDRINAQVDIYETEIYGRQRRAKVFSSNLDHFRNEHEMSGNSNFIDY